MSKQISDYVIRIDKIMPHPSGRAHEAPQMVINAALSVTALTKIMSAITTEIGKLAETGE